MTSPTQLKPSLAEQQACLQAFRNILGTDRHSGLTTFVKYTGFLIMTTRFQGYYQKRSFKRYNQPPPDTDMSEIMKIESDMDMRLYLLTHYFTPGQKAAVIYKSFKNQVSLQNFRLDLARFNGIDLTIENAQYLNLVQWNGLYIDPKFDLIMRSPPWQHIFNDPFAQSNYAPKNICIEKNPQKRDVYLYGEQLCRVIFENPTAIVDLLDMLKEYYTNIFRDRAQWLGLVFTYFQFMFKKTAGEMLCKHAYVPLYKEFLQYCEQAIGTSGLDSIEPVFIEFFLECQEEPLFTDPHLSDWQTLLTGTLEIRKKCGFIAPKKDHIGDKIIYTSTPLVWRALEYFCERFLHEEPLAGLRGIFMENDIEHFLGIYLKKPFKLILLNERGDPTPTYQKMREQIEKFSGETIEIPLDFQHHQPYFYEIDVALVWNQKLFLFEVKNTTVMRSQLMVISKWVSHDAEVQASIARKGRFLAANLTRLHTVPRLANVTEIYAMVLKMEGLVDSVNIRNAYDFKEILVELGLSASQEAKNRLIDKIESWSVRLL